MKDLVDSLKAIKNECAKMQDCGGCDVCSLSSASGKCFVSDGDNIPKHWKINAMLVLRLIATEVDDYW